MSTVHLIKTMICIDDRFQGWLLLLQIFKFEVEGPTRKLYSASLMWNSKGDGTLTGVYIVIRLM